MSGFSAVIPSLRQIRGSALLGWPYMADQAELVRSGKIISFGVLLVLLIAVLQEQKGGLKH